MKYVSLYETNTMLISECKNYNSVLFLIETLYIFSTENESGVYLRYTTFTEPIESKPCLWDKTSDRYIDKTEKSKARKEIFANIACIQYYLSCFLYFRLRYKSTSKLCFLLFPLCDVMKC
jgi:hypothetical protein